MRKKTAPTRPIRGAAKKAKDFARVSDIVLTFVFAYLAFQQSSEGGFWFWFWAGSSVFCAVAVYRSPIDMMWNAVQSRLYKSRRA